ncbi:polyketide cyclase SnoaL-like domain-containing protein [Xylariaceae sp. FL1019]|nr:polyketide cyclase SnoaL-like domain-containing protein [Xylariaceae sp. FL1019]
MATQEEERNVATVVKYFTEFWGKANPDVVDETCADDFVMNYPMHGIRNGKEEAKKMLRDLKEAFPDLTFSVYQHPIIASGEHVVGRWIGGGTHTGGAFHDVPVGGLDKPASGKKMHFSGITIFTLRNGKIVDETGEEGALTALQQLGALPGPNPGKEIKYLYE